MNNLKFIIASLIILIGIMLFLTMLNVILRKFKAKYNEEGNINLSFGIWFSTLFIACTLILEKTFFKTTESVEILLRLNTLDVYLDIGKAIGLLLGLAILWFFFWYFISHFLIKIVIREANDEAQMASNNYSYFLIKGIALIGMLVSASDLLTMILNLCVPSIEIPLFN